MQGSERHVEEGTLSSQECTVVERTADGKRTDEVVPPACVTSASLKVENISDSSVDVTPWVKHPRAGLSPLSSCLYFPLGENSWVGSIWSAFHSPPYPYSVPIQAVSQNSGIALEPQHTYPHRWPAARLGHSTRLFSFFLVMVR